ncbi:MAG: hypothetical protein KGJ55_02760 [Gammaproteobacteria bacterium]|nr:hypothetical protein [Gammaproteobacteria bacterium]
MRKFCIFLLLWLGVASAGALAAQHHWTAAELAAKNTAAKGGARALHAIRTLRLSGKLLINNGQYQLVYVELKRRPGWVRAEASLQGLTAVQAWDGKQAWQIQPFQGRKDPEQTPRDDAKGLIDDADIDGPLVDYAAKGYQLAYLGTEDVDGTQAHKIRVTQPDGDTLTVYLDPDYFLEIRIVARHLVHGAPQETVSDLGDYEKIDGVYFPFEIVSGPKGAAEDAKQKIEYDQAEANVRLDDALFHFPAAAQAK